MTQLDAAGDEDLRAFDVAESNFDADAAAKEEFGERQGTFFLEIHGGEVWQDFPARDRFVTKLNVAQNPGASADADGRSGNCGAYCAQGSCDIFRIETFAAIGCSDVKVDCFGACCGRPFRRGGEFRWCDGNRRVFSASSSSIERGLDEHVFRLVG